MTGSRLSLLANLVLFLSAVKVLSELLAAWLGEHHHTRLHSLLQRWQTAIDRASPDQLVTVPLSTVAETYERVLGEKPFSRQAFRRTCLLGSLFLAASLGFTGLLCGKPFAMNAPPWKSFMVSAHILQALATDHKLKESGGFFVTENAAALAQFNGWPSAVAFTVYFVLVLALSTAILLTLSTAVSRLFLREMISAPTFFRVFVLFVSNTALLLVLGAADSLIVFVMVNVWTWPFIPLLFALSSLSVTVGGGVAYAASMGSWFFAAPWLRVVVTLSLLPSILLGFVTGVSLFVFPQRERIHRLANRVLQTGLQSRRGVLSFLGATSNAFAFGLAALIAFTGWLSQLSLRAAVPGVFGMNYLGFCFIALGASLALSAVAVTRTRPLDCVAEVLFLFLGTLCLIVFGFYFQAIIECFLNVKSAGSPQAGGLELPGICAIIPGAIAAYAVIASWATGDRWTRAAMWIFCALSAMDIFRGLCGATSYHDVFFSVVCNVLGAPVAAFIIFKSRDFFFRPSDDAKRPYEASIDVHS